MKLNCNVFTPTIFISFQLTSIFLRPLMGFLIKSWTAFCLLRRLSLPLPLPPPLRMCLIPSRVLGWQDPVLDNVSNQNPTPRFRKSQSIMGGAVPGYQVLDEQCWNILSAAPVSTCLSVPVVSSCEPFQHDTSVLWLPWHDQPELSVAVLCMSLPGGLVIHPFIHAFLSFCIHSFISAFTSHRHFSLNIFNFEFLI